MSNYSQMNNEQLSRRIAELRKDYCHYASDMNATVPLLKECFGELVWDGEAWHVEAFGYLYASHPTNPARAICECWLAWKAGTKVAQSFAFFT